MGERRRKRDAQAGKAIERVLGDEIRIVYPDGGARPAKGRVQRGRMRENPGFGSHMNGRHKLG